MCYDCLGKVNYNEGRVFMNQYSELEFNRIIENIDNNLEFQKLKNIKHHGITRYDHSIRVAYYTFLITSFLHLNYKEATIAALLHDFFTDEVSSANGVKRLQLHPKFALNNAKKITDISKLQEDSMRTHMFPVTIRPPKYLESWIVDIVDDISAIYEKGYSTKKELNAAVGFLFVLLLRLFQ